MKYLSEEDEQWVADDLSNCLPSEPPVRVQPVVPHTCQQLTNMKTERPTIVCLCGSTRFYETFQRANYEETMAGRIVLSVGFYRPSPESQSERVRYEGTHGETWGCTPEQKMALDELHKRKIDLADEVLILNVGGYVGKSTLSEIIYADRLKKPLRWLEPMQCPCCKGRGGSDSAEDSHECALCHGAGGVGNADFRDAAT